MNAIKQDDFNVVWAPHPGSQSFALKILVNDILYCGTRGPGKTDAQLMRYRRNVGVGYGTFWRGIIFDREYKMLDDLVTKSKRWFFPLKDGARFLSSNSDYKWIWPTGEELLFRQVKTADDYWLYHGHEYPFVGWNELTKYPTYDLFEKMYSVNRSGFDPIKNTPVLDGDNYVAEWNARYPNGHYMQRPFQSGDYETPDGRPLPPIPLEMFSTCNPLGPGHNWVKRRYIDVAPYGKIVNKTTTVFDPKLKRDVDVTRSQVAIFGRHSENPNLDPIYLAGLKNASNENERKAWDDGDWDIVAGGAFDDVYKKAVHVLPRFKVPKNWRLDRALDWGSSHPFSYGLWAETNGEEITLPNGRIFCPAAGTLIQVGEIYGTKEIGSNKGLKLGAKAVAKLIKEYEAELLRSGWISGKIYDGPADNQISDVHESDSDTIEKIMSDNGVTWERSDKSAGSRKNGMQLMRDRFENLSSGEGVGLAFMDNCVASISTIPVLPRDALKIDDVDTSAEDHPYDMTRYRVLKGNNRGATVIKVNFPR
jgi:hypothetical protein